jgi:hypothetical protein
MPQKPHHMDVADMVKGSYDILPTSRVSPPKSSLCVITTRYKGRPLSFLAGRTGMASST